MTARQLLEFELDQVAKQIEVVLSDLPDERYDVKCSPVGMSPREILAHLCEACDAFVCYAKGEKYTWGSLVVETPNLATWRRYREAAVAAVTDENLKLAYDFLVGHENYHVGQLAQVRLQIQPEWDTNEIYG